MSLMQSLANDVLGQINTIAALIFCAAIIALVLIEYFALMNLKQINIIG